MESFHDLLSLAIYNLNWSLPTSASALTAHETRTNFRTWLSAVEADLETCKDGFQYAPFEVRNIVLENLDKSTKLVRNSLAIMCKIDDRIKSHEEPSDVDRIRSTKGKQHTGDHREPIWLSLEDKMLLHGSKQTMNPDVIVAADGSGNYTRIIDALNVVPLNSDLRFVIYVKKGIYYENVRVEKEKWNIMMFGDGMDNTIVSGNLSIASGTPTILTATFAAYGKGFIARDMGFQNTARAAMYQAVALLSKSDQSVFYRCSIDAYQDTLYTQSNRQFY
ncbi:hypothetical protein BUALT_Bualt05G0002400 [Buddleja alternifolia]|uniref:Pectinesterase n=1 Tax=Buddleja alternifolia TaxID=168488 RepID=A0AAV6XNB0_9LAMI|nr:hypothetical protein BUALT_Bualt05G0002400 [Buddleja alternifolia]